MMRPAIVFDLDGTLVDSAPDLTAATNHVLKTCGRREVSIAEVREMVGLGARKLISRGFERTGDPLDPARMDALYDMFLDYYEANIAAGSSVFEGVEELLERCQAAGYGLAVCTNKLEHLSKTLVRALELDSVFQTIVGPDTIGIAKPDPAPLYEAIKRISGDRTKSVMIGDTATDINTARAAGVPSIAVSFGYSTAPVPTLGADHMVDHFNEIWPIIEERFG